MDALTRYLHERGESLSAFAVRIGRSPSTLTRALAGNRDPSVSLARDVEIGTCGAIKASRFLAICIDGHEDHPNDPNEDPTNKVNAIGAIADRSLPDGEPQQAAALHPNDVDRVDPAGPDADPCGAGPAFSQEAAE